MNVSPHFMVEELTDGRGWWSQDPAGELARYEFLCRVVLEPARALLGVPMRCLSGARPVGFNDGGRASSMHLPPEQRASAAYRFRDKPAAERGAALDFVPLGMPCDEAFRLLDAAQRAGKLPPAGLFWYGPSRQNPGPASGRFVHIDYRPTGLAREADKVPPSSGRESLPR